MIPAALYGLYRHHMFNVVWCELLPLIISFASNFYNHKHSRRNSLSLACDSLSLFGSLRVYHDANYFDSNSPYMCVMKSVSVWPWYVLARRALPNWPHTNVQISHAGRSENRVAVAMKLNPIPIRQSASIWHSVTGLLLSLENLNLDCDLSVFVPPWKVPVSGVDTHRLPITSTRMH